MMGKIALACIFIAAVATALPADSVVPEYELDTAELTDLHAEAQSDVEALLQSGKTKDACASLAASTVKEIKDGVASSQKIMNAVPKGAACKTEGQAAVDSASKTLDAKTSAESSAAKAASSAKTAPVKFKSITIAEIKAGDCSAFFQDNSYLAAKKAAEAADKSLAKAQGEKKAAKTALDNAKKAQEMAIASCACKSQYAHNEAVKAAGKANSAENAKAWKKSHLMECVLAGTAAGACKVPATPKVSVPTLQEPAKSAKCNGKKPLAGISAGVPHMIGCYTDNGNRDFAHGPKRYGYTSSKCMDACTQYKYTALQDGGWCSCDNSYGTPSNTYKSRPDSECNKGFKGGGGGWRNAVYSNVKYNPLVCKVGEKASTNAGVIKTKSPLAGGTLTGGGMKQRHGHWDKLAAVEQFYPDGNSFSCDTGFGSGSLVCYGVYCTKGGKSLTCKTASHKVDNKSQTGTAKLPSGYVMTGGGIFNGDRRWNNHGQFEESIPAGDNGWTSDMGFGSGTFTSYVRGCKGLSCVTITSGQGDATVATCPSGYVVTGCGMWLNPSDRKMGPLAAFEYAMPKGDLTGCQCNMGFGPGKDKCMARCCK